MDQLIDITRDSLQRLDIAAVIDILIIAAIIYALLTVLRGTTAMTLLRGGVVTILALFLLGRILELSVVNFLVRNSLTGLVLAVVVIFQPEIRRALEHAGRTSIRRWLTNTDQYQTIEEIAAAVVALSRQRHGAIIVIERSTGLEDYIESGLRVDAGVNAKLIEGIFFPNSALHDKAMIIRGDRIVAAACTLPVASSSGSTRLGMRHRAGLGIAEQTDAVAIIVSEETGSISLGSEGRLLQLRDDSGVREALVALLSRRPASMAAPAPQVI